MLLSLPAELETAIEAALKELPASQWVSAAQNLSQRYRAEQTATKAVKAVPLASGKLAALGYVALILPATYAQLKGAMAATAGRAINWQPTSMLDIGSGPGTGLWAAVEQWPSLQSLTVWERETAFIKLGKQLAKTSPNQALQKTGWKQLRLENNLPIDSPRYDLVLLGHVLNELDANLQRKVVSWAWNHCSGLLLVVEPGTSAAFPVVKVMRQYLLELGAQTLAPCAHNGDCPLTGDWCHFPQKLKRPAFQRKAKAAAAGWEESKFSYAAMARFPPDKPIWGRLIHQPNLNKAYAELTVSSRAGIVKPRIPKRDREAYAQARDYNWGEVLDLPEDTQA